MPTRRAFLGTTATAVAATLAIGFVMFVALGRNPLAALHAFFVKPLDSLYGVSELLLKASPLMLIATGLADGYRATVWNNGAEGQLLVGAIAGGGRALAFAQARGSILRPALIVAGALGGMGWAAIPAWLRTRFKANEILVSLMLV